MGKNKKNKEIFDYTFTNEELDDFVKIEDLPKEDLPILKSSIQAKIAKMDKHVAILKGVGILSSFVFIGCAFGLASTFIFKNPEYANITRALTLTNGMSAFIGYNVCKSFQNKIGKNRIKECKLYGGVSSEYERRKKQNSNSDIEYFIED